MNKSGSATGLGEPVTACRAEALARGVWQYRHPVSLEPPVDRNAWLVDFARDRRVIHVGCATEGETATQYQAGRLLFAQLETVAAGQLGVDPDSVGMQQLNDLIRPRWPLQTCFLSEVPVNVLDEFQPQAILVPETLEHVPNAGELLAECGSVARRYGATIVITVPNALSIAAVKGWMEGVEHVHPDHVAAYTPRTLQTLVEKTGLVPQSIRPYTWGPPPQPTSPRAILGLSLRSSGSIRARWLHLFEAIFAHRFPDGWIALARPQ